MTILGLDSKIFKAWWQFYNLLNINIIKRMVDSCVARVSKWAAPCPSGDIYRAIQLPNTTFRNGIGIVSTSPP
jgi:hypothetical protein